MVVDANRSQEVFSHMGMTVESSAFTEIEAKWSKLLAGGGDLFAWERDDRYCAVLAVFGTENLDKALKILVGVFGWGRAPEDLHSASGRLQGVVEALGGMRRGQIIFSFEPVDGPTLFCAWWPWGDGSRITIRVGLHAADGTAAEYAAFANRLHDCFLSHKD